MQAGRDNRDDGGERGTEGEIAFACVDMLGHMIPMVSTSV